MSNKYFAFFPVLFLTLLLCPNVFAKYPPAQNERLVIHTLRKVYEAQVQYQASVGAGNFGSLAMLRQANLIDDVLANGQKFGYYFTLTATQTSATIPARFVLTAVPRMYRKTGIRSFYIDNRCTLRGADKSGGQATIADPAIEACVPAVIGQNEAQTIQALRKLHAAQVTYQSTVGSGTFGNLNALHSAGLINDYLASGHYAQYAFIVAPTAPTTTTPAFYQSWSLPWSYGETGIRSFYIDATGVLRGADKQGALATVNDPPVED
jgi:hypothetical protein